LLDSFNNELVFRNQDGTITDIKVLNTIPENFSKETIRVMTKFDEPWYPAVKDNKQVRCQYILPIIIDRI
jgi:hypothetical protein